MTSPTRAPRSVLYVPASRPSMLARAAELGADLLVIDLEDGVAAADKETARRNVAEAIEAGDFAKVPRWLLRVNADGTAWHDGDLALAASLRPPGVVVPKAEIPERVARLARRFEAHGSATALMIETARGVGRVRELAEAHPRIELLLYGSADLRRSLRAPADEDRGWERHALGEILLAARMGGAAAIDAVYFRLRDPEGLRRHARVARALGFDGKCCVHPDQVEVVHEVFASTPEEVAWARRVLEMWDRRGGAERGVIVVEGEMIEALHLEVARQILDRAPLG